MSTDRAHAAPATDPAPAPATDPAPAPATDPATDPDQVWAMLVRAALDGQDGWRRAVVARTGLAFGRIRVLKRVAPAPISMSDLAHAATVDRPAATVAVNELEELGLAVREVDPRNRRCKLVSITDAGRAVLETVHSTPYPAPAALTELSADELATLARLLSRLGI